MKKKKKDIEWEVIKTNLFGTPTIAEKESFQKWLETDEKHKNYIEKTLSFYSSQIYRHHKIDAKKAFLDFQSKVHSNKEKKRKRFLLQIISYAALLFLFSSGLFIVYQKTKDKESIIIESPILELSSGEKIHINTKQILRNKEQNVAIIAEGKSLKYKRTKSTKKTPCNSLNKLRIPYGQKFNLTLEDGTKVFLNSGSTIKFPSTFTGNQREVFLNGEGYFEVVSNPEKPFILNIANLKIKVLGTKFNVKAYQDEPTIQTTLVEGKVSLSTLGKDTTERFLLSSQQADYNKTTNTIEIKKVNTKLFTAWQNGSITFNSSRLDVITKTLSRQYNLKFVFSSQKLREYKFTGHVNQFDDINSILRMLEELSDIRFTKKDSTIYVESKPSF